MRDMYSPYCVRETSIYNIYIRGQSLVWGRVQVGASESEWRSNSYSRLYVCMDGWMIGCSG